MKEVPNQTDEKGRPMTYWGGLAEPSQDNRMYSEEEVLEILEHHTKYLETFIYQYIDKNDMEENKIWFEQFKKK